MEGNDQRGWLIKRPETLNPDQGRGEKGTKGSHQTSIRKPLRIITALTP